MASTPMQWSAVLWMALGLLLSLVCPAPAAGDEVGGGGTMLTEHTRSRAEGAESPPASLEQASFLIGHWQAEAFGGTTEEVWSAPAGGAMMGMFRLIKEGRPDFYEFLLLEEEAGTLVLHLKHFDGETFHGWEERTEMMTFRLVDVEPDALYFGGLTFQRTGPDSLDIYLAMRGKDGTTREEVFACTRVEAGSVEAP